MNQFSQLTGREPHPVYPVWTPEEEAVRDPEAVAKYYAARRDVMIAAAHDPLRYGYEPEVWALADKHRAELREKFPNGVIFEIDLGGNRCLHGSTKIYDPLLGITRRVDEISSEHHVWSWNGHRLVIAKAGIPFQKGLGQMYQVCLSNGVELILSGTHRVYGFGHWRDVSKLQPGFAFFLPQSTSDSDRSIHVSSDLSFAGIGLGSRFGYPILNRLCDEPLHWVRDNVQYFSPSPVDAPRRTSLYGSIFRLLWRLSSYLSVDIQDALDTRFSHNQASLQSCLHSILGVLLRFLGRCVGSVYCVFCKPYRLALRSLCRLKTDEDFLRFVPVSSLPESKPGFGQLDNESDYELTYVVDIKKAGIDVKWDFTVAAESNYICGGIIHHNSGKSKRAAKRVVQDMVKNPGRKWWCCQSTERMSRDVQQNYMYEFIPPEWRNMKRSRLTKVNWSLGGGFTENYFVLPNGSQNHFMFYEMNLKNLPGPELDGIWADELITPDWIDLLTYRLVNRNGIFHITFTPEQGYTPTVGMFLDDAKVVEETEAELDPIRDKKGKIVGYNKVKRIVFCKDPKARIIYFHTIDNPFGNYEGMKAELANKPREEVLMRAYGEVSKAAYAQFHTFSDKVHKISLNRFEEIVKAHPNGTRFHLVDPCSGRNWFMIWIYSWALGKKVIYREWPSHGHLDAYIPGVGDPGPWAVLGEPVDGKAGPAQNPFGFGLEDYKQEILRVEHGEEIYERWIDARFANTPHAEREGSTTLIEQMESLGFFFLAMVSETRILGVNDGSIDMIRSALRYDKNTPLGEFSAELSAVNEPNLLVTENCPNTIFALKNWTGRDGNKGACKDPVDCVRGAVLSELDYVDEKKLKSRSDWSNQLVSR